jgi:glycerol-3-phosphate acyltransferase PlsY
LNALSYLGLPSIDDLGDLSGPLVLAAVAGYFIGAIPFGYLVARAHGVNIFETGSKSPGATNVRRVLGARAGNLVFAFDALKGAVAAAWPLYFFWRASQGGASQEVLLAAIFVAKLLGVVGLLAALAGHSFSCFTRFRGGKGVATAAGGFLVLMPLAALTAAAVWVLLFYATRYVSLASIVAAAALPVATYFFGGLPFLVLIAVVVAAFIIVRHRANLGRLIHGTENRFGAKKEAES